MNQEEIKALAKIATRPEEEDYKIIQIKDAEDLKLGMSRKTGFSPLDEILLGGVRDGDLMIISGLSGYGKTAISLQMIKNFSDTGIPVLLFSFEETIQRIKWRLGNIGCEKDVLCFVPKKLKSGYVEWLENKILDGLHNYFIKIIVIDNLDFLTAEKKLKDDDKWSIQSRIVAMLKRIAIEHGVSIILNAHVKKTDDSIPKMEDLYGSGDTYKLADFVVFVHRLRENSGNTRTQARGEFTNKTKIVVEKNRLTGKCVSFELEMRDGIFYEL